MKNLKDVLEKLRVDDIIISPIDSPKGVVEEFLNYINYDPKNPKFKDGNKEFVMEYDPTHLTLLFYIADVDVFNQLEAITNNTKINYSFGIMDEEWSGLYIDVKKSWKSTNGDGEFILDILKKVYDICDIN